MHINVYNILNLDLMECICKNGLPEGDIYEYAAYTIANYEKKWKKIKSEEIKEKINKYKEEKEKELVENGNYSLKYKIFRK